VDIRDATSLTWSAGDSAASHDVYLGTDRAAVAAAGPNAPEYQGNRQTTDVRLVGLVTFGGGDYYWRVDEVESDGTVHTGQVWAFTVPDYLIVDDFEHYTDNIEAGETIFDTWIDGWTNGSGSVVGYLDSPFAEQKIVHSGAQSMPLDYNNVNPPYYSEASRTWEAAQDWTAYDLDTLTLYVRGRTINGLDDLYVAVVDDAGNTSVIVHPDSSVLVTTAWTAWDLPFGRLTADGVDVAAIERIIIGLGNRENPQPGGAGLLYIDDLRVRKIGTP
jgi:hypothetical protein